MALVSKTKFLETLIIYVKEINLMYLFEATSPEIEERKKSYMQIFRYIAKATKADYDSIKGNRTLSAARAYEDGTKACLALTYKSDIDKYNKSVYVDFDAKTKRWSVAAAAGESAVPRKLPAPATHTKSLSRLLKLLTLNDVITYKVASEVENKFKLEESISTIDEFKLYENLWES